MLMIATIRRYSLEVPLAIGLRTTLQPESYYHIEKNGDVQIGLGIDNGVD